MGVVVDLNAISDSSDPRWKSLTQYEKVRLSGEFVLKKGEIFSSDKAISGRELFDQCFNIFPDFDVPFNTFIVSLSALVKSLDSTIDCLGRKQGYFYSLEAAETENGQAESEKTQDSVQQETKTREKERLLYNCGKSWLLGQNYRSQITARATGNGKWGNPDVVGIRSDDTFGNHSFETITLEIKLSTDNWQQWIFEAVSHKRFANRSYFVFAHPENLANKMPADLRYYSELYKIGVIALLIENEKYQNLRNGAIKEELAFEEVEIVELYSAPYTAIQPMHQKKFLNGLDISDIKDLYTWGEESLKGSAG